MNEPSAPQRLSVCRPRASQSTRDDSILREFNREGDVVRVQCSARTRDLLRRAGHRRARVFDFYPVRVQEDHLGRLALHGSNPPTLQPSNPL